MEPENSSVLWILITGFIFAFVLAFGIGANDVANSFGTSVGSKVLTLKQACVIASIFELGGSILIGAKVSDTIRKGIIDINSFNGTEEYAMAGALSALTGTSIWLLVATFFNLPVSGTHSIVGATIGYALVAFGASGIQWKSFGTIAASWVISPLLSGIVSSLIFVAIDKLILESKEPLRNGLRALPFMFATTISINLLSIFFSNGDAFGMENFAWYYIILICLGVAIVTGIAVQFGLVPWFRRIIERKTAAETQIVFKADKDGGGVPMEQDVAILKLTRRGSLSQGNEAPIDPSAEVKEKSDVIYDRDGVELKVLPNGDSHEDTIANYLVDSKELPPSSDGEEQFQLEPNWHEGEKHDKHVLVVSEGHDGDEGGDRKSRGYSRQRNHSILSTISSQLTRQARSRSVSLREIMMTPPTPPKEADATLKIQDDAHSGILFKYLQILTASFGAFAHGGNDVSNAIGPVISLWIIYQTGEVASKASTPIWILIYGGVGIVIGLCVWGQRVIRTIGENLSPITPSSGFSIEIGSALTVLLASNLGIPVSTTHCKVGSVVCVGRVRSKEVVNWKLFGNIVLSWIVTMPVTGGISAAVYAVLRKVM